jgi:hypothetical protein
MDDISVPSGCGMIGKRLMDYSGFSEEKNYNGAVRPNIMEFD